jgi:anti-sigma regulatory factor (Ser/Thr protein kinase)
MKTITLQNDITEIPHLKARVADYGKIQALSDDLIQDVQLVLEEMVSNIIFYGYTDVQPHQIVVIVDIAKDTLMIEIRDDAQPFNPLAKSAPDLTVPFEDREIGGMGIHLMRTLMDNVAYHTVEGQNILRMTKQLHPHH